MDPREELIALRRLAELEAKASGKKRSGPSDEDKKLYSPELKGDGTFLGDLKANAGNFVAAYGSAIPQMARGIGQLVGSVSQEEVDEAKRLDAPLMDTKAGIAGNITGNVAATVPLAFVPGGLTLRGAATTGAVLGATQPVATGESRLQNTALGGGAGAGGVVAGRALAGAAGGVKALVEPFTAGGRDRIAGRMIQRFAADPNNIRGVSSAPTMTGARPTLAEQTGDAGLARLEDSLRSVDPQINSQIGGRLAENNAARVSALRGLTGEDGARDFAFANRNGTAEQLYEAAFAANSAITPSQLKAQATLLKGPRIQALLETPAIAEARKTAQTIAANRGKSLDDPAGSIEGLHYMKLAMDDAISSARAKGTSAGDNVAASIQSAQKRLVDALETLSPDYKAARVTYAQMSKPVNSFDTAAEVAKRGLSNTSDLSGTPVIQRNALLSAIRDEEALVARGTGRKGLGGLSDVMEPNDLNMLRSIASESDRAGAVAAAGNGPGSATAQRMASQNILRSIVGPAGLPSSWAEGVLANTVIGKPFNLLYGGIAEPKIQQALAQAVLDPANARRVFQAAQIPPAQQNMLLQLVSQAAKSTPAAGAVAWER